MSEKDPAMLNAQLNEHYMYMYMAVVYIYKVSYNFGNGFVDMHAEVQFKISSFLICGMNFQVMCNQ